MVWSGLAFVPFFFAWPPFFLAHASPRLRFVCVRISWFEKGRWFCVVWPRGVEEEDRRPRVLDLLLRHFFSTSFLAFSLAATSMLWSTRGASGP